jgi:transposase-like protein
LTSRQFKKRAILNLKQEGKTVREIARELHYSSRDIVEMLREADIERNSGEIRIQRESLAAQAYKLFEDGKKPIEVAIILKLRQPEVLYHEEYLKLIALSNFLYVYNQIKEDPRPFVQLYRFLEHEGYDYQHILRLLKLANNDLPSLQLKYQSICRKIDFSEDEISKSAITFQELSNQISYLNRLIDQHQSSVEDAKREKAEVKLEKERLENIVEYFRNHDRKYNRIKEAAKEEVENILGDNKRLLKVALRRLIESLRLNPVKAGLLYFNLSTLETAERSALDHDYEELILDQTEKIYNKMSEKLTDRIMENLV